MERVEGLTVRVVSNVRKRAEVKPKFLNAFQEAESFPTDLPYTQKVGLLMQCYCFSVLAQRLIAPWN